MKSLNDRLKGFEAAFQHDQERNFRISARRNRLFGLWVAERLGITTGEAAETYAKTVVAADFEVPGDSDVIAKVRADLAAKGVPASDVELSAELKRAAEEARRQLSEV